MMRSRIAVLGGTGFVGRALIKRLLADDHEVIVLSRNRNRHADRLFPPDVILREIDVYDVQALSQAFVGVDVVINLVGILNERGDNGRGFRRTHVTLTKQVIAACQLAGVTRLLQMSSLNAGRGKSHYLISRGEAEAAVKSSGLDWTIFEPSVIFGVGDGLFTRFGRLLKLFPVMPLACANARLAPVYVLDVAEAMRRALSDSRSFGEVYELYGPNVFTLKDIVRMSAKQLGLCRLLIPLPDMLGRLQGLICDFLPGKPFSSDNFRSLLVDSVGGIDGLHRLGIQPVSVMQILPDILGHSDDKQARLDYCRATRQTIPQEIDR